MNSIFKSGRFLWRIWALVICLLATKPFISVADEALKLGADATVSILNRSARVQPDGTWRIDNVPANFGQVRVRATSVKNGVTQSGQSDFVTLTSNSITGIGSFSLGNATQIPAKLSLTATANSLTSSGATSQITVVATYPDATTNNITAATNGTSYTISNPSVATVDANGLVTAISSGTVLVSALNEGAVGIIQLRGQSERVKP